MSNFKPQLTVITNETRREYSNSNGKKNPYQTIQYPTYKELKRNMKKHLEENIEENISVSRSRRGEWGEWFEIWKLVDEKPMIVKEGWQ
jgi:hypothetical protein